MRVKNKKLGIGSLGYEANLTDKSGFHNNGGILSSNQHTDSTTKQAQSARNEVVKHTYFNESSPNIMHANPHATSAAIGGAIGGLDQDEDGNIVFNPQGFALGLLGGAGGSKGIERITRLAKYPKARAAMERVRLK